MKTMIISEALHGTVTLTVRLPFAEASMLLDVVTDSVILGHTKQDTQEWAEQFMRDLDDHLQRTEGSNNSSAFMVVNTEKDRSPVRRCPYCGFYSPRRADVNGIPAPCTNCKEI